MKYLERGKKPAQEQYAAFMDFIAPGDQKITAIESHGKKTWLKVGGVWNVLFSYGLSGTFVLPGELTEEEQARESKNFVYEIIVTSDAGDTKTVYFSDSIAYGSASFISNENLQNVISKLGPDPLKGPIKDGYLSTLKEKRSTRDISDFLTDNKVIAGMGNTYLSEVLYKTGVHPTAIVGSIPDKVLNQIQVYSVSVMKEAYECMCQNTNYKFSVYAKASDPRGRTVSKIRSSYNQSARYYCEDVQKIGRVTL